MGDIKVDEIEFYFFINLVDLYVRNSIKQVNGDLQKNGLSIMSSVKNYQEIAQLKMMRQNYYDFYINNRNSNSVEANKAYQCYLKIKEKLDKINS